MPNDQLWAPWRLGYVQGTHATAQPPAPQQLLEGADPACFLCRCAVPGDDRASLVPWRTTLTCTVLNRFPYNNGHLLLAPRRHVARLEQLTTAEHTELGHGLARLVSTLEQVLKAEGFNVGLNLGRVAGAGLPGHLHWHVVPRWTGDTNFMPVLAETNVIPQSLDALWQLLVAALNPSPQT
ncbi:MAG: HIT domain-containing protein [Pirellulales bacterium]|nr:HIT domain-containing protein [Pirellulales bacterium]